jgi:hypothetical protein
LVTFFTTSSIINFSAVAGVQTNSVSTVLSATTYPQIFLAGFQQVGPVSNASVTELYFSNVAGTWNVVMSAENPSGKSYTINYYYK